MIGFFGNSLIFGIIFRFTGGGWTGAAIATVAGLALAVVIIKKFEKQPLKKIFGTGMLTASVLLFMMPLILWIMLLSMFQGIAN